MRDPTTYISRICELRWHDGLQSVLPVPGKDLALPWYAQERDGAGHSLTRRTPLSGAQQSGGTAHTELKTRAARDSRQPSASVMHQSIGPSSGVPLCKAHTVERPEQMPEQRTRQRKTDELPRAVQKAPCRPRPTGGSSSGDGEGWRYASRASSKARGHLLRCGESASLRADASGGTAHLSAPS